MKDGRTTHHTSPEEAAPARSPRDFDEAVLCHLDMVYRIALRLSGDSHEAEDLVQETFLRAHQAFGRFEFREFGTKPWLLKILHNVFFSRREQGSKAPVAGEDVELEELADRTPRQNGTGWRLMIGNRAAASKAAVEQRAEVDWECFDEELKEAVESLAPEYRTVLLLWALGDLSYKEIADVLDCAIGTVMSRLFRARQQLSSALRAYACESGVLRKSKVRQTDE